MFARLILSGIAVLVLAALPTRPVPTTTETLTGKPTINEAGTATGNPPQVKYWTTYGVMVPTRWGATPKTNTVSGKIADQVPPVSDHLRRLQEALDKKKDVTVTFTDGVITDVTINN